MILPLLLLSLTAQAKIGSAEGQRHGGRLYCAGTNEVFALRPPSKDYTCHDYDGSAKVHPLWKTVLPFRVEPEHYQPNLEQDVQWCIVTDISVVHGQVLAVNCRGDRYTLSAKTGKLVKTEPFR